MPRRKIGWLTNLLFILLFIHFSSLMYCHFLLLFASIWSWEAGFIQFLNQKKNGILKKLIHCKLKLLMFSAVVVRECHIHLRMIFSVVDVKNNLQLKAFVLKKEISKLKIIFLGSYDDNVIDLFWSRFSVQLIKANWYLLLLYEERWYKFAMISITIVSLF